MVQTRVTRKAGDAAVERYCCPSPEPWPCMNPSAYPAAKLLEVERKNLAILALAGSATISDLAAQHGVSRKFIYQQTHKASVALDEVFASAAPDDEVLFELAVTKTGAFKQTAQKFHRMGK